MVADAMRGDEQVCLDSAHKEQTGQERQRIGNTITHSNTGDASDKSVRHGSPVTPDGVGSTTVTTEDPKLCAEKVNKLKEASTRVHRCDSELKHECPNTCQNLEDSLNASPQGGDGIGLNLRVASINFLGEEFNPVQWMISNDAEFKRRYDIVSKAFFGVNTQDIIQTATDIFDEEFVRSIKKKLEAAHGNQPDVRGIPFAEVSFGKILQDGPDENAPRIGREFLDRDNKFDIKDRINLIVGGLHPTRAGEGRPLPLYKVAFHKTGGWEELMREQIGYYKEDKDGYQMAAWDIACNLAVSRTKDTYMELAEASQYNDENIPKQVESMLAQIHAERVVVAVQEFPTIGSPKYDILLQRLNEHKLKHFRLPKKEDSVGFVLSTEIWEDPPLQQPFIFEKVPPDAFAKFLADARRSIAPDAEEGKELKDPKAEAKAQSQAASAYSALVANIVLETMNAALARDMKMDDFSDGNMGKLHKAIDTTSRKTMMLDTEQNLRFITLHAKEFPGVNGYKFLATYIRALAAYQDEARSRTVVAMVDANTKNNLMVEAFAGGLSAEGFKILTQAKQYITTRKMRTELHGQLYDVEKRMGMVESHKDFIVVLPPEVPSVSVGQWEAVGKAIAFPDLKTDKDLLLPFKDWPSDHCMVKVELARKGGKVDADGKVHAESRRIFLGSFWIAAVLILCACAGCLACRM